MTRSIRKHSLYTMGLVAALNGVSLCQAQRASLSPVRLTKQITTANNRFGFRLFDNLTKKQPDTNVCVSPTSISQALQMVYNGAAGRTSTGMALALSLQGLSLADVNQGSHNLLSSLPTNTAVAAKPQLAIANSLWIKQSQHLLPAFVQSTQTYYNAQVGSLQGAPNNINAWVAQHTNNKIMQIVTADDVAKAEAILVNAVYFKGQWNTPFNSQNTVDAPFHMAGGKVKSCKLMTLNSHFNYTQGDTFQMVRLPYQEERLEMVIVLPKSGISLNALTGKLTLEDWKGWTGQTVSTPGVVELPRFRAEFTVTLKNALGELGMADAFTGRANFSLMSHEGLYISRVLHKTFIEVNEQGTEAAAATAVGMTKGIAPAPPPPFRMRMDRPFLYAIQDHQTGAILFLGTLNAP